jgi:hypothetical protein
MMLRRNVNRKETGVDLIETRNSKFYRKYNYRARFTLPGAGRTWGLVDIVEFRYRIHNTTEDLKTIGIWGSINDTYRTKQLEAIGLINFNQIERFLKWKASNTNGKLRVERDTVSWFTEDIEDLKTIEKWFKGEIEYTKVEANTPMGVKYFARQPKHPYRVYLRNRMVTEQIRQDIYKFIADYEHTSTVIVPSPALNWWLNISHTHWQRTYLYESYFIDFDDETTLTLMAMIFGEYLGFKFKCEKRPEPQ